MAFQNALDFEVNLVPSGIEFQANDTDPVSPNATKVYNWPVSDRVSPLGKHCTHRVASLKLWQPSLLCLLPCSSAALHCTGWARSFRCQLNDLDVRVSEMPAGCLIAC